MPLFAFLFALAAAPPALPDIEFGTNAGRKMALSELKGRVVLVNFWASWCVPCREEMPALDRLAKSKPDSLRVIGLSIDARGWPAVTPFLRQHSIGFPVAIANRAALRAFGFRETPALPQTFLFGRDGKLILHFSTALNEADLRKLVEAAE
ncbi:MAG: TlpA disulfide reductase family protein [Bryobacteraceae bacterium]|nr:TlpA disulfide reductase family protein [Bryobacteraceae bacterium]